MMKMYNKIAVLAALALIFVGCTKQEHLTYTQLNSSEVDYSDAVEGDALSYGVSMAQSDYFDETVLQLDKSSVLSALGASSLPSSAVLYGYEDGAKVFGPDAYTSTTGFYFDSEGDVCSSADEDAVLYADFNASSLSLTIGQVPEVCEVGKTYTFVTGIATASALCPIKIEVEITEAGSWCGYTVGDDGLTYDVYEQVKMDYTPCKVEIDASALCSALGVSSASKIASGISDNSVVFYGMNSDGSLYTAGSTANNSGHWFNTSGDVCSWKADNWFIYSEWDNSTPIIFNVGQGLENSVVGQNVTIRQKFVYGSNEAVLTFNVHIVDTIPDGCIIPEE